MKNVFNKLLGCLLVLLTLISATSCSSKQDDINTDNYQNFTVDKDKYKLEKVLVFSRHNIRSPLSTGGSTLSEVTNHEWFDWSSEASELSLRGGDLETQMGQYFRKYLVDNGLMKENWQPSDKEVRLYANSMQRTIATTNYFSSGMFPIANIDIEYHMDIGTMDPVFTPAITYKSNKYAEQVYKEANEIIDLPELEDNYKKLESVLDYSESNMAKTLPHLVTNDAELLLELKEEPKVSGSLNIANAAADALKLQFYEEKDEVKAAFGDSITMSDWLDITHISDVYEKLLFMLPSVCVNIAHPLLQEISKELNNNERIFTFLCGHDSNIASVLSALNVEEYELPNTLEKLTPIGSKIVIEKWLNKKDNKEYVSVCLVYQSLSQLKDMTILDLDNPPVKYHLSFKDLKANEDGLYEFATFNKRIDEAINAYDNLKTQYGD